MKLQKKSQSEYQKVLQEKLRSGQALFITFEGGEGSGKSTQIALCAAALAANNVAVVQTREPGGTELGKALRQLLLHRNSVDIAPLTELFLYAADRAQHVSQVLLPALQAKSWVLCDRFEDSTLVYQGLGRKLELKLVENICHSARGSLQADMSFFLDIPVQTGLQRCQKRSSQTQDLEDRFEREELDFHERVRQGFLARAQAEPERIRLIDAAPEPEIVHQAIWQHIKALF